MKTETDQTAVGAQVDRRGRPRDEALEALSEKVRQGEPIDALDAIAVVEYQEASRRYREANTALARFKRWLRAA